MKTKKKINLCEIVKKISSPYRSIDEQLRIDCDIKNMLKDTKDIEKYDMNKMFPKVTYDDWVVCLYEGDNKFYYIDEEQIIKVKPIMVFERDDKYKSYFDNHGKMIYDEDDLLNHIDTSYICCGEADDLKKYIVFDLDEYVVINSDR